jgi:3-oxoacyl-(acyl-carrier-protein) synthase
MKQDKEQKNHEDTLQQYRDELEALKASKIKQVAANNAHQMTKACGDVTSASTPCKGNPAKPELGSAQEEWERLKREEHANSWAIEQLMHMIGLEGVKKEFLSIKATVDTAVHQGVSLQRERFGMTLLGNPGTSKQFISRSFTATDQDLQAKPLSPDFTPSYLHSWG